MNWKTRQLFSDREHGIVSGLSPINMVNGGSVPIPGYQTGGLALDLFEEGDQEINEPLNMMAQAVSPSLDVGPTEIEEAVTMDQGPITETVEEISIEEEPGGYEIELQVLKRAFKDDIRSYVSEGGSGELEEYLGKMSVVYGNQLDELKRKYGVTEYSPEEELITPDFMSELESLASIPEFQSGGVDIFDETVIAGMDNDTLQTALNNYFEGKQPVNAKLWRTVPPDGRKVLAIEVLGGGAGAGTGTGLAEALAALKKERMDLVPELGRAAGAAYKTKEGGWGGLLGKLQAQKAGETLAQDKILTEQTELLSRLSGGAGAPTSIMDALTATESEMVTGAGSNKFEIQKQKHKQSTWTNLLRNEQGNPKPGGFMRAMKLYLLMYNAPPEGFKNSIESDWEGTRRYKGKEMTWRDYMDTVLSNINNEAEYITALSGWLTLDRVEE